MEENERLSRFFFKPPTPPTEAQTEAFVARLMERLDEEQPASGLLWWLGRPWLVPTLGLALASMMAFIRVQTPIPAGLFDHAAVQFDMLPHTAAPAAEEP